MLQIFAKFLNKPSAEAIEGIVRQVAELSLEGVCEHVAAHVDAMTLSEARGYVRARAAKVVRRQARKAISRHPAGIQEYTEEIVRAATERILPSVLRQTSVGIPRAVELPMAA